MSLFLAFDVVSWMPFGVWYRMAAAHLFVYSPTYWPAREKLFGARILVLHCWIWSLKRLVMQFKFSTCEQMRDMLT